MTLRNAIMAATVLVMSTSVVPALAHDDEENSYSSHEQFHDQLSGAHELAHEYGFYSRGEHRAYHRALRDLHDDAHGYQPAPRYCYNSRPRYYGYGFGYNYRSY